MREVKNVNYIFFATMLILLGASYIPFGSITNNKIGLLLISQGLIVIPTVMYFIGTKSKYCETVGLKKIRVSNVILTAIFTICMIPVMGFVNGLSQLYAVDSTTSTMTQITESNPFLISLLCIAVVPAILEESVYRGIFYQNYRKVNPLGAIFLSAFLFGILHGNLNQFTYALFMGIIFALVIEATDTIASSMTMHFIINGNSVVLLYLLPKLLDWLQTIYQNAVASGETELADMIINNLGGANFSMDTIMLEATEISCNTLGMVLRTYGFSALVGGVLAFIVYRAIAINCGRWEHVKSLFVRKNSNNLKTEENTFTLSYVEEKPTSNERVSFWKIWTWPLTIAVVVLVINMILNEIITRGVL